MIMKKLKLPVFICCIILSACGKQCPEFNADILNWIPYHVNDTISFRKNNEIVQMIVTNTFLEHTGKQKNKCACSNLYGFDAGDYARHISVSCYDDQVFIPDVLELHIDTYSTSPNGLRNLSTLPSITIDSVTYQDIRVFTGDSISGIWKVMFAKNKGIIALYYSDSVMVTNRNTYKEAGVSDFNMKTMSCN
jgi:hypothetical protein